MVQETQSEREQIMTMPEAQDYLVSYGVPVRSRFTFYRYLEKYGIPYVNLTPWSRYANRRFRKSDLDKFLAEMGCRTDTN